MSYPFHYMAQAGFYLFHVQSKRFIWVFDGLLIGRSQGDERFPDDRALSRLHARLFLKDGQIYIEDLDTKNHTLLNFKQVETGKPKPIHNRDVIICGAQKFILSDSDKVNPATLLETNALDLQMAGVPTYEIPNDSPDISLELETKRLAAKKIGVVWRNNRRVLLLPISVVATTFAMLALFEVVRITTHIFTDQSAQVGFILAGILTALVSFSLLRMKWMRRAQDSDFKTAVLAVAAAIVIFGLYARTAVLRTNTSRISAFQLTDGNCPSPLMDTLFNVFGVAIDEDGCRIEKILRVFEPKQAEKTAKELCPNTVALHSTIACYKEVISLSSAAKEYSLASREKLLEIGSQIIKSISLAEPMRLQYLKELQEQIGPLEKSSQQPDLF